MITSKKTISLIHTFAVVVCILSLVGCGGSNNGNTPTYSLGGTVSGLTTDGLVLANGADTVNIASGRTSFTLPTKLAQEMSYSVVVQTQPTTRDQFCSVTSGSGIVGSQDVASIQVVCRDTQWMVTTFAGSGASGATNGTGSAASFFSPYGISLDGNGNIYIADSSTQLIRRITADGVVTTFAGSGTHGSLDGTGSAASFSHPVDVVADSSGNIYVADTNNNTIRKITPTGIVTTLVGSAGLWGSADGTGSSARFSSPQGLAVDQSGNIYVADTFNSTIRKVTPSGVVTTFAGSAGLWGSVDGTGSSAKFHSPTGLAVDQSGNIYVADSSNNTIRKITPSGIVSTFAGIAGTAGGLDGTASAATFNNPWRLALDQNDNIYVADTGNNNIRKITPAGVVTTLAGSGFGYFFDGLGSIATFNEPIGLVIDQSGNIFVVDSHNNKIRKIVAQ